MNLHPSRASNVDQLRNLDPQRDAETIYRRTTFYEFPSESRLGFQLAFYRPLAVPRMAAVLVDSGHFLRETTKRAYDSGVVIHEVIAGGLDSDRARRMVALMNKLHNRPDIEQRDLTYVLLALIVVPTRLADQYGYRAVLDVEKEAAARFYAGLGQLMNIEQLPPSYAEACDWFDAYEAEHVAPSDDAARLTAAVMGALRDRMPSVLRPLAPQIMSAILDDRRLTSALALPAPSRVLRRLIAIAFSIRGTIEARSPARTEPNFEPGQVVRHAYPQGYRLDDIGPSRVAD